jgi:plastocyanin
MIRIPLAAALLLLASAASARPTTHQITIGPGFAFNPPTLNAQSGDTVTWSGLAAFHTVTQTTAAGTCLVESSPLFGSPFGATSYSWTIPTAFTGQVFYKCNPHCQVSGMRGTIIIAAPPPCLGDANGDRIVNFADVTAVLENWTGPGPAGDADHDNDVDFADVTAVLQAFALPCP